MKRVKRIWERIKRIEQNSRPPERPPLPEQDKPIIMPPPTG
jgi:hypothetical protein